MTWQEAIGEWRRTHPVEFGGAGSWVGWPSVSVHRWLELTHPELAAGITIYMVADYLLPFREAEKKERRRQQRAAAKERKKTPRKPTYKDWLRKIKGDDGAGA